MITRPMMYAALACMSAAVLVVSASAGQIHVNKPDMPTAVRIGDMPAESDWLSVVEPEHGFKMSWRRSHASRGQTQTAYRLVVTKHDGAPVWDSGKVPGASSSVLYHGPTLPAASSFLAFVQWWDSNDQPSPLSAPKRFDTALDSTSWNNTEWIGLEAGMVRKEFTFNPAAGHTPKLTLSIAGIGFFQAYINGQRVGTDVLAGAWTTYNERVLYYTYDVSDLVEAGKPNAVAVYLGRGWRDTSSFPVKYDSNMCDEYERLLRLAIIDVAASDSGFVLGTDETWSVSSNGPIVSDSIYNGETYDARLEQPGWMRPGFTPPANGGWGEALSVDCFNPILSPLPMPGVAVMRTTPPVKVTRLSDGSQVVDFGENLSGWCRLKVKGAAGTQVELRHAEVLMHEPYGPANGSVYTGNLRSAKATDVYILKGDPSGETYEPHFTYHGFQYVQVYNYPGDITSDDLVQVHFRTANPIQTNYSGSSEVLNRIQYAALTGQGSNMMTVPTDCDQRDERLGWMGDAGLSAESMALNYDCAAFQDNFVRNMVDQQDSSGSLPDTVPFMRYGGRPADPSWSAAFPENLYARLSINSDANPAKLYWSQLLKYFENIAQQVSAAGSFTKWKAPYGDWVPADPSKKVSNSLPASANYIINIFEAVKLAKATGQSKYAAKLEGIGAALQKKWQSDWYDPTTGCWDICGQTSYSLAYQAGLVNATMSPAIASALEHDITVTYKNHVSTGIIGAKALFPTLSSIGLGDLALSLAEVTTVPSWGYMLYNTIEPAKASIWELWLAPSTGPGMNSRNHHMFSSISAWIVRAAGGLASGGPGSACNADSEPLVLKPAVMSGLSSSQLSIAGPCGTVSMAYTREGGQQCGRSPEGRSSMRPGSPSVRPLVLDCGVSGGVIKSIDFASWGFPSGACGKMSANATCHAQNSTQAVENLCLGKGSCSVPTDADSWLALNAGASFGSGDCNADPTSVRSLAVQYTCSAPHTLRVDASVPVGAAASLHLPTYGVPSSQVSVTEGGDLVFKGAVGGRSDLPLGISTLQWGSEGEVVAKIGSGDYSFVLSSM